MTRLDKKLDNWLIENARPMGLYRSTRSHLYTDNRAGIRRYSSPRNFSSRVNWVIEDGIGYYSRKLTTEMGGD